MESTLSQKILSGRKLRALSQENLANEIGVSKQMISKYERGLSVPSSNVLIKLAKSLQVNLDYLFTPPAVKFGSVNFRKKSRLPIKRLNSIKEEIKLKLTDYIEIENILQINNIFDPPAKNIKINSSQDVIDIVAEVRIKWKIGFDPVHNIIQLLEDQKIKIIEIEEEENLFDGLAALIDNKYAVIVINKNFPIERKRFTLLHELGHLVLNFPNWIDKKKEEKYCHLFAAEFLFPRSDVVKEFGIKRNSISLQELIEIQKKYGISIQAIYYRLLDAGLISSYQHTQFYKRINNDINFKNEIKAERFPSKEFSNRYEQLIYRAYSEQLISDSKASNLLGININEILDKKMIG